MTLSLALLGLAAFFFVLHVVAGTSMVLVAIPLIAFGVLWAFALFVVFVGATAVVLAELHGKKHK